MPALAIDSWSLIVQSHLQVLSACDALGQSIAQTTKTLKKCLAEGGKVIVCGNGGSQAQAQHFVAELAVRFKRERAALAAIALGCNPAVLTATCNDLGAGNIFLREMQSVSGPKDAVIGISTSGRSRNVIDTLVAARRAGLPTIGLTGANGIDDAVLHEICVPSTDTPRIQEVHQLIIHAICEGLDG